MNGWGTKYLMFGIVRKPFLLVDIVKMKMKVGFTMIKGNYLPTPFSMLFSCCGCF